MADIRIRDGTVSTIDAEAEDENFEQERFAQEEHGYSYYVRQSIVVLITRLLFLGLIAAFAHSLTLAPFVSNLENSFLTALGLTWAVQLVISAVSLFIVLQWIKTTYVIRPQAITEHRGIITVTEKDYSTERIESVIVQQSIWGKIFNYGTIVVFNPVLKEDLQLIDIPHPFLYARVIGERQSKESVRFFPKRT